MTVDRVYLSRAAIWRLGQLLIQVCRKPEGAEFAVYDDGCDDRTVAEEFNRSAALGDEICNAGHVRRLRDAMIGRLRAPRASRAPVQPDLEALEAQVRALAKQVDTLEDQNAALVDRMCKLEARWIQTALPLSGGGGLLVDTVLHGEG